MRLSALNGTVHQEWYFDSFSSDGTSDITIVFFHQPGAADEIFVLFSAVWPNGTTSDHTILVEQSEVNICTHQTTGIWSSPNRSIIFTFVLESSLKQATITADTPTIKGVWHINSTTPARYPSGELYPCQTATPYFAPYNWWEEAIHSGTVDASFEIDGTPLSFCGFGGHETFWTAFPPWNYISNDWIWARFVAGPYTAVVWYYNSSVDNKLQANNFTVSLLHNGGMSDGIINNATGFGFDFVQAVQASSEGKRWHFELTHNRLGLQSYGSSSNYTRFVDVVSGGQMGGTVYEGSGQSEQVTYCAAPLP